MLVKCFELVIRTHSKHCWIIFFFYFFFLFLGLYFQLSDQSWVPLPTFFETATATSILYKSSGAYLSSHINVAFMPLEHPGRSLSRNQHTLGGSSSLWGLLLWTVKSCIFFFSIFFDIFHSKTFHSHFGMSWPLMLVDVSFSLLTTTSNL